MSSFAVNKFLCVLEPRTGVLAQGYVGSIGSLLQLVVTSVLWAIYPYYENTEQSGVSVHEGYIMSSSTYNYTYSSIIYPFHATLLVLFVVFSIILIIGVSRNNMSLVKIYFIYIFFQIALMVILTVVESCRPGLHGGRYAAMVFGFEIAVLVACQFGVKAYLEKAVPDLSVGYVIGPAGANLKLLGDQQQPSAPYAV